MTTFKLLGLLLFFSAGVYLVWPTPGFPNFPSDSLVSNEPADTESIYRQAFYTNLTRAEIIDFYQDQWQPPFASFIVPPEDAGTVIRDQTRSSWLEELSHPFKDSLYINGFYPTKPTEQINLQGRHWEGKITLRYVPSTITTRLTVLLLTALATYFITKEYAKI
jgi:hypothetical protein